MVAPESALSIARKAEELAAKATPGPWASSQPAGDLGWAPAGSAQVRADTQDRLLCLIPFGQIHKDDAAFIAFARTALPILARAVLEGEAIVEAAQAVNDSNGEKLRHGRASRAEIRLDYALRTKRRAP